MVTLSLLSQGFFLHQPMLMAANLAEAASCAPLEQPLAPALAPSPSQGFQRPGVFKGLGPALWLAGLLGLGSSSCGVPYDGPCDARLDVRPDARADARYDARRDTGRRDTGRDVRVDASRDVARDVRVDARTGSDAASEDVISVDRPRADTGTVDARRDVPEASIDASIDAASDTGRNDSARADAPAVDTRGDASRDVRADAAGDRPRG